MQSANIGIRTIAFFRKGALSNGIYTEEELEGVDRSLILAQERLFATQNDLRQFIWGGVFPIPDTWRNSYSERQSFDTR